MVGKSLRNFIHKSAIYSLTIYKYFFLVWRDSGVSFMSRISRLPEHQVVLRLDCSTAALTTPQKVYPSENWLSSRCLTSVIERELVPGEP